MKRILLFICVLTLIVSSFSFYSSAAAISVDTVLSEPIINFDYEAYFCTDSYLVYFCWDPYSVIGNPSSTTPTNINNSCNLSVYLDSTNNTLNIVAGLGNSSVINFKVDYYFIRLSDGRMTSHRYWYSGNSPFVYTSNNVYNNYLFVNIQNTNGFQYDPINICWADDIVAKNTLNEIKASRNLLNQILQQDSSYYDAIQEFINLFFLTSQDDLPSQFYPYTWDYFINRFGSVAENLNHFAIMFNEWYTEEWRPAEQAKIDKLDSIIKLITGGVDSPKYESEEVSGFQDSIEEHNELESQFIQDKSQDLHSLNDSLHSTDGVFGNNHQTAFVLIKALLEDHVIGFPVYGALVIFNIAMGIVVLIIGRRIRS